MAGRVLLKIVYPLVRQVLGLFVLVFRKDLANDAELLVLRHENAVLRRHAWRIRYEPADRVWFAALARLIPRSCRAEVFPVTPATLLAWHRKLAARKYDTSKRRKPGRPPAVRSIARLAVRLAKENPLWGYRRIHGELTKLGVRIAPSTVYEIAVRLWGLRLQRPYRGRSQKAAVLGEQSRGARQGTAQRICRDRVLCEVLTTPRRPAAPVLTRFRSCQALMQ